MSSQLQVTLLTKKSRQLGVLRIDLIVLTHEGVNWRSKYVTQVQQQRPESPTVTQSLPVPLACV